MLRDNLRRCVPKDENAIGQVEGLIDIVGYQHNRLGMVRSNLEEEILHPEPGQGVQGGKRFVEKQNIGFGGKPPGQSHALGHASGKLVWPGVGGILEPNLRQQPANAIAAGVPAAACAECDIGRH